MNSFSDFVKKNIRHFGFDIQRYRPQLSNDAQLIVMLKEHKINLVFDVGANIGQFGKLLRNSGYNDRIISFEPLSIAREQLLITSNNDTLWNVAPQAAIGNEDGEIEIHIAGNSVSSSALNMLDAHANAAPGSAYVGSEKVALRCLDTIASEYLYPDTILFIKIDTQGFEHRVLQGASDLLTKAVGLQLELSLVPLYEGQILYDELIAQLKILGFDLWGITSAFINPTSGRVLQVDATFFKR